MTIPKINWRSLTQILKLVIFSTSLILRLCSYSHAQQAQPSSTQFDQKLNGTSRSCEPEKPLSSFQEPPRDRHDPIPPALQGERPQSLFLQLNDPFYSIATNRNKFRDCYGILFGSKYIGEVIGNTTGGQQTGTIYEGKYRMSLDIDFDRLAGIDNFIFHASGSQLHGRGIAAYNVSAIMPPSNIEATPATRLYEIWLQKGFFNDLINVRLGELGSDQEFMYPQWAVLFLNNTFGWASIVNANLPSGGPSFPLSSVGARVKLNPNEHFSFLASILDGNPAGPQGLFGNPDPQVRNPNGLLFRMTDPPLLLTEAQIKNKIANLDSVIKLGYWRHYGHFQDQRLSTDFLSTLDPNSNGILLVHRGNFGYYAIIDQQIAQGNGKDRGAGFFARASASPNNRNLINFYADCGLSFVGFFSSRPSDLFGVGLGYARISPDAIIADIDLSYYSGNLQAPVRSSEFLLEATYIAQIIPGWFLQPDFQYIQRPGGNLSDSRDQNGVKPISNSIILGLRTIMRF